MAQHNSLGRSRRTGVNRILAPPCLALALWQLPTPAEAKVFIPHVGELSDEQVCATATKGCRATTSPDWHVPKEPFAYSGEPAELLGRSYRKLEESTPCVAAVVTSFDIFRSEPVISEVRIRRKGRDAIGFRISGVIGSFFKNIFGGSNEGGGRFVAAFQREVNRELRQNATIEYSRRELQAGFMDRHLAQCLALAGDRRVITGLSMVRISGETMRRRVSELMAEFEASGEFQSLSTKGRAIYASQRDKVVTTIFRENSFVLGVAYRT